MTWFLDSPARLAQERQELELLTQRNDWLTRCDWCAQLDPLALSVNVDFAIGHTTYELVLTYSDLFPFTPPIVKPRNPNQRLSSHQYLDGTLCLEWRPDTWSPEVTGAQVLESAYKLLDSEATPTAEPVPSEHVVSTGQQLRGETFRVVYTPALKAQIQTLPDGSALTIKLSMICHTTAVVYFVDQISLPSGNDWHDDTLPMSVRSEARGVFNVEGKLFKSASLFLPPIVNTGGDLENILAKAGFGEKVLFDSVASATPDTKPLRRVFITDATGDLNGYLLGDSAQKPVAKYAIVETGGPASLRLPNEFDGLKERSVGIVGLGSLGSKVAVALGRCGVKNFVLVDDDIFLPDNVSRNNLDWEDVGVHKVDGVAHALNSIAPGMSVTCIRQQVSGQESATTAAATLSKLVSCDVIIDATANSLCFGQLAAAATRRRRTLIWAEIFAGGIGGLVARSRPDKDPSPYGVRNGLAAYLNTVPPPEGRALTGYVVEEQGTVLTASDVDVTIVGGWTAQMAIDALLLRDPSIFPQSVYLIGLRKDWIFEGPFCTQPVDVSGVPDTRLESHPTDEEKKVSIQFVIDTIKKQVNVNCPGTQGNS